MESKTGYRIEVWEAFSTYEEACAAFDRIVDAYPFTGKAISFDLFETEVDEDDVFGEMVDQLDCVSRYAK